MKLLKAVLLLIIRSVIFIGIPVAIIYTINASYPGLLTNRYINALKIAMYLGIPIIIVYFLADLTDGWLSMVSELIALFLVLAYTFLILGTGITEIDYDKARVMLYYPYLLYIIIVGVLVRFPTPILKYLAAMESTNNPDYEEEENQEYYET